MIQEPFISLLPYWEILARAWHINADARGRWLCATRFALPCCQSMAKCECYCPGWCDLGSLESLPHSPKKSKSEPKLDCATQYYPPSQIQFCMSCCRRQWNDCHGQDSWPEQASLRRAGGTAAHARVLGICTCLLLSTSAALFPAPLFYAPE